MLYIVHGMVCYFSSLFVIITSCLSHHFDTFTHKFGIRVARLAPGHQQPPTLQLVLFWSNNHTSYVLLPLSHLHLVMHVWVISANIGAGNSWVPSGTKPLIKPMLAHCQLVNGNKLQWNLNKNISIPCHYNAIENVICKMAAIGFRTNCVK